MRVAPATPVLQTRLQLARALKFAIRTDGRGFARNLVDHKRAAATGTITGQTAQPGRIAKFDGSTGYYQFSAYPVLKTSDGAGGGDFTVMAFAAPTTGATGENLVGQRQDGTFQWRLESNVNNAGVNSSGSFAITTYGGTFRIVGANSVVDGGWHTYVGRRLGTTLTLWVDGLLKATTTAAAQTVYSATQKFELGRLADKSPSALFYTAQMAVVYGWDRALADAEIRALARDPFLLLRPADRMVARAPAGGFNPLLFSRARSMGGRVR